MVASFLYLLKPLNGGGGGGGGGVKVGTHITYPANDQKPSKFPWAVRY